MPLLPLSRNRSRVGVVVNIPLMSMPPTTITPPILFLCFLLPFFLVSWKPSSRFHNSDLREWDVSAVVAVDENKNIQ